MTLNAIVAGGKKSFHYKKLMNESEELNKKKSPARSESEHSFAYKYKLNLTEQQIQIILKWEGAVRFLKNAAKEHRELVYQQSKNKSTSEKLYVNYENQSNFLPEIKKMQGFDFIKEVPSQTLQASLKDVDISFQKFFKGESGYPRWKTKNKSKVSLRFPNGDRIIFSKKNKNKATILLPKIGELAIKSGNRNLPKNARIRYATITSNTAKTEFYISLNMGIDQEVYNQSIKENKGEPVGIDRGIVVAMQLSNGEQHIFPKETVDDNKIKIKKLQRKLAKQKKGSANYKKTQERIAKVHKKIKNIRHDFLHKATTHIAKNHSLVVLENLRVKNMTKSSKGTIDNPGVNVKQKSGLNRELLNIGFGLIGDMLDYKCKWYKSYLIEVVARNSSRECAPCGFTSKANRKTLCVFHCQQCGHKENADLNSSKVILARGLRVLACGDSVSDSCENKNLKKNRKPRKSKKQEPDSRYLESPTLGN
jgi:putative transposase